MKQRKITEQDYLKANRKASREEEIAQFGKQVTHRTKVQKSKKTYDRKGQKVAIKKLPFFVATLNIPPMSIIKFDKINIFVLHF